MGAKAKRAVIYARLSVSSEESVSIDRQVESCTKYAESRGWTVVGVKVDLGVSASKNKPEERAGWRDVLAFPEPYDVVVVWKLDRLARRIVDFWDAVQALEARASAVAVVEENFDLTTSIGKIIAGVLAGFAEMEAEAISTRVAGARKHLIENRRAVGGTVPYGYRNVDNANGPGKVIDQDPETIGFVREATERALAGDTVYSIKQWLSTAAPLPKPSQAGRKGDGWAYSTVERLLRNPILAGMIAYNPGNAEKERGHEVLRDEHGLPVVDESLAVITTDERRRMLAILDCEDKAQRKPRASREVTSALFSGLATCGDCDRTMHRGTVSGRPGLTCPKCYQTIGLRQLTEHVRERLLDERGDEVAFEVEDATVDNSAELADIEEAIADVTSKLSRDDVDVPKLFDQLAGLKELRANARDAAPTRQHLHIHDFPVREEWEAATNDDERRAVLVGQMASLRIVRGKVGRYLDPKRVVIEWRASMSPDDAMSELFSTMQPGDTYTAANA